MPRGIPKSRLDILATMKLRRWSPNPSQDASRRVTVLMTERGCLWDPNTGNLNNDEDGELIVEAVKFYREHGGSDHG